MDAQSIRQVCPFAESLFMFQFEPDALDQDEYEALMEQLEEESLCPACDEESVRNMKLLDLAALMR